MFRLVMDAETGRQFRLEDTDELTADLARLSEKECSHPQTEIRRVIVSGGAIQFRKQCLTCGELVSQAIAKNRAPTNCAEIDEALRKIYRESRSLSRDDVIQRHVQKQKSETSNFWKKYSAYLKTPEWRAIRARVLRRAGDRCEGCGASNATQVHHLTYDHLFCEFLFELVALCEACHDRLHEAKALNEWGDDLPCLGCRYQTENDNRQWCGVFDVPAVKALSPAGECGPAYAGFEPLQ
jgi:hypothetical protein